MNFFMQFRQVSHAHETAEATEQDLYVRFKTLQRQLEFVEIQASISKCRVLKKLCEQRWIL